MAKYYTPTRLSENIAETPEGFLLCSNVPIARTGWMDYGEGETPLETGDDGVIRIYRGPEDVFSPITISSAEGKAITIRHPVDFVCPENWSFLSKGIMQNIRKSDEQDENGDEILLADLLVMDGFAIKLVKAGLREVSLGYDAEYEQTGEGEGKQTNIVINHCALVEEGRAGPTYAINDEKGKATKMSAKLIEKLKAKFGAKAVDEAMAEPKKEKEKEEKAKDAVEPEKKEEKAKDAGAYDELVKAVKDLGAKVEGMCKPAKDDMDASEDEESEEPKKEKEKPAKDEEGSKIEERLKALEAAVAKLLDLEGKEESEDESEESDESEDEETEESEDEEKSEESEKKKTGDAVKAKTGLEGTKPVKSFDGLDGGGSEEITAEKMNEINAAHWARK